MLTLTLGEYEFWGDFEPIIQWRVTSSSSSSRFEALEDFLSSHTSDLLEIDHSLLEP